MLASRYEVGTYQAGEGHLLMRHRLSMARRSRLIIACHGRTPAAANGESCLQFAPNAGGFGPHLRAMIMAGYDVLSIDAGGKLSWSNLASETACHAAYTWAVGASGFAPAKKAAWLGYSMGGGVVCNYAHAHPENVAGMLLEAPSVDIEALYPAYTAEIDAAYASTGGWPANVSRSPKRFADTLTIPTRIYSAIDDTTVPTQTARDFCVALGSTDKALTELPNGGHAAFWGNINNAPLVRWLDGLDWG